MERHFGIVPEIGSDVDPVCIVVAGCLWVVHFHHDGFEFNEGAMPAHDFDLAGRLERYSRVDRLVYLERDPRDVMLSLYMQITGRFRDFFHYEGSLSELFGTTISGAHHLKQFSEMWALIAERKSGF